MYRSQNCDTSDLERQLRAARDEAEVLRQQREADQEREREASERARRERFAGYEERNRQAETWPDALGKQSYLCAREARQFTTEDDPESFFATTAAACDLAIELWHEEQHKRDDQIAELLRQLAQLEYEIAGAVADRLEQEQPTSGVRSVVTALRDSTEADDLSDYLGAWLNW